MESAKIISPEHEKQAREHFRKLYETKFEWADDNLLKSLVDVHYAAMIENLDYEMYKQETELGS